MAEKEYIERELAEKTIDRFEGYLDDDMIFRIKYALRKHIPAADVAPVKHGHWILLRESEITGFNPEFAGRDPIGGYQCSNCKEEAIFDCNDEFVLSSYCPNCGAKMDGGEGE